MKQPNLSLHLSITQAIIVGYILDYYWFQFTSYCNNYFVVRILLDCDNGLLLTIIGLNREFAFYFLLAQRSSDLDRICNGNIRSDQCY